MGCLRPFGTPNHIRQCSHSHPDLFIDLFVQCTVFVFFFPLLQCKETSETVLCSSPSPGEPQPSARDVSMQHSSFTLMGFLAHPAVPITQPTPSVTQPLSPCLSHLSNPFPVHLGCDLSPGNEVKPLATSPTCLWEPL